MIEDTLNEYLRLIDEATESRADILVFPEGCLNYVGIATRKLLIKYAVELNDDDIHNSTSFNNNCDYAKKSPVRFLLFYFLFLLRMFISFHAIFVALFFRPRP